jgi:integrase/recombinase XerD
VCNLKLSDIDRTRMQIRVFHGKGSKTRYVPLAQNLLGLLDEYIHFYEPQNFFFEGRIKGEAISTETLGVIIRRSLRNAGIEKKASFHTLRHSYATHLLEQGVNLKAIQQLLGHSSLRSTSIYLHVQDLSKLDIKSPFDTL